MPFSASPSIANSSSSLLYHHSALHYKYAQQLRDVFHRISRYRNQVRVAPSALLAIVSNILYSMAVTVGDIEHYAITLIQIVAPSGEAFPQETGL
jgi:hypothetical protein